MNTTSDNITDTAGPKAIVATASANDLTTTLVVWLAIVSIVLGSLVVLVVYLNRRIRVVSEQLDEVTRQVANLPKTAPVLPKREKEIVTIDDVEGAEGLMTRVNAELSVAVGGQNVVGTAEHLMPLLSDVGHPPASPLSEKQSARDRIAAEGAPSRRLYPVAAAPSWMDLEHKMEALSIERDDFREESALRFPLAMANARETYFSRRMVCVEKPSEQSEIVVRPGVLCGLGFNTPRKNVPSNVPRKKTLLATRLPRRVN